MVQKVLWINETRGMGAHYLYNQSLASIDPTNRHPTHTYLYVALTTFTGPDANTAFESSGVLSPDPATTKNHLDDAMTFLHAFARSCFQPKKRFLISLPKYRRVLLMVREASRVASDTYCEFHGHSVGSLQRTNKLLEYQ